MGLSGRSTYQIQDLDSGQGGEVERRGVVEGGGGGPAVETSAAAAANGAAAAAAGGAGAHQMNDLLPSCCADLHMCKTDMFC